MRILTLVSGPAQGSGVRTAAAGLSTVLESLGHEVILLGIDTVPRRTGNRMNVENLRSAGRDVCCVASAVRRNRPEVVWFHSLGFPLLPALRTLAVVATIRLCRVPVVTHLHAYGLDERALASRRWSRWAVHAFGRLSATVVTLHEASARAVGSILSADRVGVLPNVVDVPPEPMPLPGRKPRRIVFVGGLVRRKGVPELLDAMRILGEGYELHLVGGAGEDGPAAAKTLIDEAADLTASGRAVFEGELDDEGVREQLRMSDLFVLPSYAEGTPVALLEAMAEGRPVVVADAGDMADIVRAAGCGQVLDSRDPNAIASAIVAVLGDDRSPSSDAAASRSHQAALHQYSPAAVGPAVRDLLASVVPA